MRKRRKDRKKARARDGHGRAMLPITLSADDRVVLEQVAEWHGIRHLAPAARRALHNVYLETATLAVEPAGQWTREYHPAAALPIRLSLDEERMLAAVAGAIGVTTMAEALRFCIHRELATLR